LQDAKTLSITERPSLGKAVIEHRAQFFKERAQFFKEPASGTKTLAMGTLLPMIL
jgi:hypothetical protein